MGGVRDDQEGKQRQIKDGKMGMDEGNRRRRKGICKMSKQGMNESSFVVCVPA